MTARLIKRLRLMSADNARQFANDFLTQPNKYLGQSGDWTGENEFQQDASRQAFLRDYAEKLRQMAPKPPFEFVYAAELAIGRYDKKLGGFPLQGSPDLSVKSAIRLATAMARFQMAGAAAPD